MSEVHALKCDQCGKLEDLVVDTTAIEFAGEEMVFGESESSPPGWYEVRKQPEKEHVAKDHDALHFCALECLVDFFLRKVPVDDLDIPDAFKAMDS